MTASEATEIVSEEERIKQLSPAEFEAEMLAGINIEAASVADEVEADDEY